MKVFCLVHVSLSLVSGCGCAVRVCFALRSITTNAFAKHRTGMLGDRQRWRESEKRCEHVCWVAFLTRSIMPSIQILRTGVGYADAK